MEFPIVDFLKQYSLDESVRAHMPGNKGKLRIPLSFDITEIDGADFLFSPNGIIKRSEENAALMFETGATLYSTEGSSLCIKTMIGLLKKLGIKKVLSPRNSHISFIHALALCEVEPVWMYSESETNDVSSVFVTPKEIDKALSESGCKALYITSPDYLGRILDIKAIAEVCRRHGALLLVDNAHGAYLKFLKTDIHPITLGADMCCDSAHKTLNALTGAAYLHISKSADKRLQALAKEVMRVFATTSPSYLLLSSLDSLNSPAEAMSIKLAESRAVKLKQSIKDLGYRDISDEPLKITILSSDGNELYRQLSEHGIVCEYHDRSVTVLMLSSQNSDLDFKKIYGALLKISRFFDCKATPAEGFFITPKESAKSIGEAIFSPEEEISINDACGRICANAAILCPPCVPIVVPGEVFDENAIKILKRYGISSVNVIQ